ncbi:Neuroligin-1 [Folsomia candida]|uniref:Neuroligin-1 n=2 Tax=Folsomia candida TaxID=158441 RepID=A0A226DLK7_FOLCA|nr:Neuroligin-1 [Folsomia candida]
MVPNIVPIVSLFLLYVIPSPPRPDHFMPVHLSGSNSDLISTFTAAAATTIATRFYSSTSSCLLVSVITAIFVSILSPVVASASSQKWSPRHVDTKMGVVQGYIVYPNGFDGVEVLLNLPYASPPLGNLRFMPPVSGSPWSGVRRSEKPAPVCPQVLPDIRNESDALKSMPRGRLIQLQRLLPHLKNQSEDCLYLNLYVPLKVAEGRIQEKLPILVFVHGEDYGWGAGHPYDPSMLVSYGNIIVVTLNYR